MSSVLIVGGGITALSTAWECRRRGYKTSLIYKRRQGAATRAAGGMLSPSGEADGALNDLIALSVDSCAIYPEWIKQVESASGVRCEYQQTGTLLLALHNDHFKELEHLSRFQERFQLSSTWVNRQEVRTLEPNLASRQVGGLFCKNDHHVDPRQLQMALRQALINQGVRITEVQSLSIDIDNDDFRGIRSERATHRADYTILSDGSWTSLLFDIPLRPVKGQYLLLKGNHLIERVVRTPDVYLIPRSNGQIYLGATMEEEGFATHRTAGAAMDLLYHAFQVLRGIYELEILEHSIGFRPAVRDNQPVISNTPYAGLWVNTAHYRHGIMLAPQAASLLCDLLEGAASIPSFSLQRFM